ncbi:hypothetical protein A0J61_05360 [Choanephora cucurbitarum]|uniref:Cytochrome P450 n=1 Tax=Choanephora cucurbitarum TaxID=101091 RepID=A0A1C7NBV3_9FUNG|nr:hypothetical protein A0J61_05360 [Choanephora cucurbitarum]
MPHLTEKSLIAAFFLLACIYNDRAIFDSNRPGIKTKPGWPLVGNLPSLLKNVTRLHDFMLDSCNQLGALTMTMSSLGIPRHIGTLDPKNVEHILKNNFENYIKGPEFHTGMMDLFGNGIFNANGEEWKYQRKTASAIFNVKNFRDQFTIVFVGELEIMSKAIFEEAVDRNQAVDFHETMFKFTLDSFIMLGFGVQLNSILTKGQVPFAHAFDEAQKNTFLRFVNPLWPATERLLGFLMPWKASMRNNLKIVNDFARQVIQERRAQMALGEIHTDLLSRFMNAQNHKGDILSDNELRDIVLNFVVAGRDTTAQALSWTFYMLMHHSRVERKLLEEVDSSILEEDIHQLPVLYEKIKKMTYAHAVFFEVLRLYPSVPLNQKYALKDDVWPDGTAIKQGDYVLWCPYAQGRLEKIWGADAKEFRPERWITSEGELRRESPGQWPAFHAGPRVCLGQQLATLEALIVIAFLLKRYKFTLLPGQDITYQISLTLPMKNGMKVMVERRR